MKNDKRRITAKERADVVIETYAGIFANFDTFWFRRFLIKEFGRHVKAAHKRHARKHSKKYIDIPRLCADVQYITYRGARGNFITYTGNDES